MPTTKIGITIAIELVYFLLTVNFLNKTHLSLQGHYYTEVLIRRAS